MKHILKKKNLSVMIILLLLLTGCGKYNQTGMIQSAVLGIDEIVPETAVSYEPCELDFLCYGGVEEKSIWNKAVKEFENKYPGIFVNLQFEEDESLFEPSKLCDVNRMDWEQIYLMDCAKDSFYNLYDASGHLSLGEFGQENLNHCTVEEELLAVPEFSGISCFMFQETVFQNAGVEIPESYQQLLKCGEEFNNRLGEDYYPLVLDEEDRILFLITWLQSHSGKPWTVDGVLQYSTEEVEKGLDLLVEMEENHVIPRLECIQENGSIDNGWCNGFYGGVFDWDTLWPVYQKKVLDSGKVALRVPFREFQSHHGQIIKIMETFSVSKETEHPNEAALLIDFFVNQKEGVEKLADLEKVPLSRYARRVYEEEELVSEEYLFYKKDVPACVPAYVDSEVEKICYRLPKKYCQIMNGFGYGDYTQREAAQLLIDRIEHGEN